MMNNDDFRKEARRLADWMADYFENVEQYPVKSASKPGDVFRQLPDKAPENTEPFEQIFSDFEQIIMPGMTHWESPKFMGYFPANKSYPSILAEMLTATLGAQCMSWITSPAAAELEEQMMIWLRDMVGLPENFTGVIQDTASTATLAALLMAREKITDFEVNDSGFPPDQKFAVYCSTETHSSIEKDVKIVGFGRQNLRTIAVDKHFAMQPKELKKAIENDLKNGCKPACVIATLGTTGSTAIDPLKEISAICSEFNIFLHVDAAYAGTALLLPEMQAMIEGVENVDSFVFNPHKWMFTNFDCSAFFVQDENLLVQTFEITPEYLKSSNDEQVKNYRDWGIQLGRRFRALKLWFVIRSFGVKGLQQKIRGHLELAAQFKKWIEETDDFELLAPVPFNLVCFRYHPSHINDEEKLDTLNGKLLDEINGSEKLFLTHTRLNGIFTIRMVIGNTNVQQHHVAEAWQLIQKMAKTKQP